jgi:hypothetical protein
MLDDFMNETLTLHKKSTGHFHKFRAMVQSTRGMIYTNDGRLPVEEGDQIERPLPTSVETYTVVDRGYYPEINGIPPHYQMKVRKNTGEAEAPRQAGQVTHIYNLTGAQARINIQSDDKSVNISSVTNEQLFAGIANEIKQHVADESQQSEMLIKLDALKRADSKTIRERYREFISTAADHMTLLAPFLPALTALLVSLK